LKTSFEYFKVLADFHGNATARSLVGFFYATGLGGAVKQDLAKVNVHLAVIYETTYTFIKSLLYHSFASLSEEPLSQLTLGYRYLSGIGTPKNCNRAIYYYEKVAKAGELAFRIAFSNPLTKLVVLDHYLAGPPGGRALPLSKVKLYEDFGGIYGLKVEESQTVTITEDVLEYYKFMADRGESSAQVIFSVHWRMLI
jgi:SEL1 protein